MSTAAAQIRAEIAEHGAIPFARFMELALYCPLCGYYEKKKDTTGKCGDFYTSVSVGPLFGELLAFQFVNWLEQSAAPNPKLATSAAESRRFQLVEAGAHDGHLAADILTWLKLHRPEIFARVEYLIVEPSPRRRGWQREALQSFDGKVRWLDQLTDPDSQTQAQNSFAVCFANELLDAFPVQRLGWDARRREWFEWGVTADAERFVWTRLPSQSVIPTPQSEILDVLPDGFTTEACPAAEKWWREAATWLQQGKLLTLDYGLEAEEFFSPQRANGTLRAYHRHQLNDDLLANAGDQDLTAHVNFTAIRLAGEAAGLRTENNSSQSRFLTDIAQRAWREHCGFGPWTPERTRQFQTLTHPNHLGRAFRVLTQER